MTSPIIERAARAIFPTLARLNDFYAEGIGEYDDPDEDYLRELSIRTVEKVLEVVSPPPMTGRILDHTKIGVGEI